jgi:diacylglycerol kinase family enzyme
MEGDEETLSACLESLNKADGGILSGRDRVELVRGSESLIVLQDKTTVHAIPFRDIVYVTPTAEGIEIGALTYVMGSRVCGCRASKLSSRDRVFVKLDFTFASSSTSRLVRCLNSLCLLSPQVQKALVVINPVSGSGTAMHDWTHKVEPILKRSGHFSWEVVVTDRRGHAFDIGAGPMADLLDCAGEEKIFLISLGGDGVIFEILNGIKQSRPNKYMSILKRLVLCPLPSGSGNGLCCSMLCLADEPFTLNCALRLLLRRNITSKDLGLVKFDTDQTRLFALTVSWGLVADVDIHSEFLRKYVGGFRFTLYGLYKVLEKRLYAGELRWGESKTENESDYLTVFATLVPVAAKTVILSTSKPLNDGLVRIHRMKGSQISRFGLIGAMTELEKRREHDITGFEPIVTDGFQLSPGLLSSGQHSAGIVVDGEQLTSGSVDVSVVRDACLILTD